MAHIVLEGYSPKEGEFVSTGPSVVEGIVTGTAVRALCGKEWVPGRNPSRYGLCPTCKEIAEAMGWQIPDELSAEQLSAALSSELTSRPDDSA